MFYWWVRVFNWINDGDHHYDDEDYNWCNRGKGEMLDEFYIELDVNDRNRAKEEVKKRLNNKDLKFAKPRKDKDGVYAVIMDSSKLWHDRFYNQIDTYCICCHKPIKGPAANFPRIDWNDFSSNDNFYCSYECKREVENKLRGDEGEFQERETPAGIVGYIYHMYNRKEDKHYIGQTKYLPFFRWQEHIKSGLKGNICDITFEVLTEVNKYYSSNEKNQEYMNNIEAWWIQKYRDEGFEIINDVIPRITIESLKKAFREFVAGQQEIAI